MPWKPSDASDHVRGLSPHQQTVWARVANDALKRCLADGGSTAACDARAIRQANAVAQRAPKAAMSEGRERKAAPGHLLWPDPSGVAPDVPEGTLEAVFSVFDVVDADGDVVLASAFDDGEELPLVWAHDWRQPVGKGTVRVEPDRAVFRGRFFLDTQAGAEAYKTVKAMGALQEFSWGFRVLDAEPGERDGQAVRFIKRTERFEVSPVLVGANRQTGTLLLKAADADAEPTDAAAHAYDDETLALADHVGRVLHDVPAVVTRWRSLVTLCTKEGRAISEARRTRLATLRDALRAGADDLDGLLTETEPKPKDDAKAAVETDAAVVDGLPLLVEYQHILARLNGVPA